MAVELKEVEDYLVLPVSSHTGSWYVVFVIIFYIRKSFVFKIKYFRFLVDISFMDIY